MEIEIEALPKVLQKRGVKEKLAEICKRNDIVFMAVFGSFVRGEKDKKSDIDIAIEFDKNKEKSLFDLVHVENELKKLFKRKVDLGIFSSLSPYVIEDVRKEMCVIYEERLTKTCCTIGKYCKD